jgi:hypothetical protein
LGLAGGVSTTDGGVKYAALLSRPAAGSGTMADTSFTWPTAFADALVMSALLNET